MDAMKSTTPAEKTEALLDYWVWIRHACPECCLPLVVCGGQHDK
jgi:hypothetical protein